MGKTVSSQEPLDFSQASVGGESILQCTFGTTRRLIQKQNLVLPGVLYTLVSGVTNQSYHRPSAGWSLDVPGSICEPRYRSP